MRTQCIVDDGLQGIGHSEDSRWKLSDSDVIVTALSSVLYFGGHLDNGRGFMKTIGLMPGMLDKSEFNRRSHQVRAEDFGCSGNWDIDATVYLEYAINGLSGKRYRSKSIKNTL